MIKEMNTQSKTDKKGIDNIMVYSMKVSDDDIYTLTPIQEN